VEVQVCSAHSEHLLDVTIEELVVVALFRLENG